ncbi:YdcF family protein [Rubritalea tangerina]|uniref:YdcF family protein n=1 Tax=Rubritalea tangerina TaxID=430798 RepID=A0ABW4ZAV5_9BACT
MSKKLSFKKRWGRRLKWLSLAVVLAFGYVIWQLWDINRVGFSDDGGEADCAIVLGAAAYHKKPSPVFQARIDHAIKLYKDGRVSKVLLTGGFGENAQFAESEVALEYCKKMGVPERDLLIEKQSQTTEQNIIEAQQVMQQEELDSALIVSDPWHLKRALAMTRKHDLEASGSATRTSMYRSEKSKWGFLMRELYYLHIWRLAGE